MTEDSQGSGPDGITDGALRALLEPVLDLMDAAPSPEDLMDIAGVTLDCVFHRLVQSGASKHMISAMLRKVAREI